MSYGDDMDDFAAELEQREQDAKETESKEHWEGIN